MDSDERGKFDEECDLLIGQVLGKMDIVLASCNNPGTISVVQYFKLDVNAIDEVGRLIVPTSCVPLAIFTTWKGLLLSGKINELKSLVISTGLNELLSNARLSPTALAGCCEVFTSINIGMCQNSRKCRSVFSPSPSSPLPHLQHLLLSNPRLRPRLQKPSSELTK